MLVVQISFSQTSSKRYNSYLNRYEYFDGYGNMTGYEKWNSYKNQWDYYAVNNSNVYNRKPIELAPVTSNVDIDLVNKALAENQRRYDNQVAEAKKTAEREILIEREKAINRMNQIIDYYNRTKSYPSTIKDGWHIVYVMNNYDFCDQRKVYIEGNKVTKYVVDNLYHRTVTNSLPIQNAKTTIKLKESDNDFLNVFFLDAIADPNSYSSPPEQSGKISFWTNYEKGYLDIFVEDSYIGTLKSHFKTGNPVCQQSGTVVYENRPGTYKFEAVSGSAKWSGTITITHGGSCNLMQLSKK